MEIEEYKKKYIAEMMEQSELSEKEAMECVEALGEETLAEYAEFGDPAFDVENEISSWD